MFWGTSWSRGGSLIALLGSHHSHHSQRLQHNISLEGVSWLHNFTLSPCLFAVSLRNQTVQHRRKELKVIVAKVCNTSQTSHIRPIVLVFTPSWRLWSPSSQSKLLILITIIDAAQVDKRSLIIFPAVSILFNAGYWVHFLLAKWSHSENIWTAVKWPDRA